MSESVSISKKFHAIKLSEFWQLGVILALFFENQNLIDIFLQQSIHLAKGFQKIYISVYKSIKILKTTDRWDQEKYQIWVHFWKNLFNFSYLFSLSKITSASWSDRILRILKTFWFYFNKKEDNKKKTLLVKIYEKI
jgi:hypothetical protein